MNISKFIDNTKANPLPTVIALGVTYLLFIVLRNNFGNTTIGSLFERSSYTTREYDVVLNSGKTVITANAEVKKGDSCFAFESIEYSSGIDQEKSHCYKAYYLTKAFVNDGKQIKFGTDEPCELFVKGNSSCIDDSGNSWSVRLKGLE